MDLEDPDAILEMGEGKLNQINHIQKEYTSKEIGKKIEEKSVRQNRKRSRERVNGGK
jgi:hypothetical protein